MNSAAIFVGLWSLAAFGLVFMIFTEETGWSEPKEEWLQRADVSHGSVKYDVRYDKTNPEIMQAKMYNDKWRTINHFKLNSKGEKIPIEPMGYYAVGESIIEYKQSSLQLIYYGTVKNISDGEVLSYVGIISSIKNISTGEVGFPVGNSGNIIEVK